VDCGWCCAQALYDAASENELEDMMTVLALYADANWLNHQMENRTPLHAASERGHVHAAEYLCQNGARVQMVDRAGKTPIDLALDNGFTELHKMLLRKVA
jgi:ankyrin repeat protein